VSWAAPTPKDVRPGLQAARATILLGASNAWFPITLSASRFQSPQIQSRKGRRSVEPAGWDHGKDFLSYAKANVPALRPLAHVNDDRLWEAIDNHRERLESGVEETLDLHTPEWGVLANRAGS
jgi:hypothetical protein